MVMNRNLIIRGGMGKIQGGNNMMGKRFDRNSIGNWLRIGRKSLKNLMFEFPIKFFPHHVVIPLEKYYYDDDDNKHENIMNSIVHLHRAFNAIKLHLETLK